MSQSSKTIPVFAKFLPFPAPREQWQNHISVWISSLTYCSFPKHLVSIKATFNCKALLLPFWSSRKRTGGVPRSSDFSSVSYHLWYILLWAKHLTLYILRVNTHFVNPTGWLGRSAEIRYRRAIWKLVCYVIQYLKEQCSWTINIKLSSKSQNFNQWKELIATYCWGGKVRVPWATPLTGSIPRAPAHPEPPF